ncbi:DUF443 family protein [Staphylococcus caprae]|uniref:DUF443 family protein n=1 Tax=Staphylococcus caprae TaxID=29380 RepID=UPI003B22856F
MEKISKDLKNETNFIEDKNEGEHTIINTINIETIEKNSKYKLIRYKDSYYVIDLNRNKLTYLFPLLNYVTRQLLIKIDKEELESIKTSYINEDKRNKTNALGSIGTGIGLLFATLTKSLLDYMDFTTNSMVSLILVIIAIIPLIIVKRFVDKKKKEELGVKLNGDKLRAFVFPNVKEIIKNILINFVVSFVFIVLVLGVMIEKQSNIIYFLCMMMTLACILFQNVFLYAQTEITGKIAGIK